MDKYKIVIFFLLSVHFGKCFDRQEIVRRTYAKIDELKTKYKNLYGGAVKKLLKVWEFELDDKLGYPRGDKYKLNEISKQWIKYYTCCAQSLKKVTSSGTIAAVSVTAYEGAVVRVPCTVCVTPLHPAPTWVYASVSDAGTSDVIRHSVTAYEGAVVRVPCTVCVTPLHPAPTWVYASSLDNLTYVPMEDKETFVFADGVLSIYQVKGDDAGVYMCQHGGSEGVTVMLSVVDYYNGENYTVVKPRTSRGPYAAPPDIYKDIVIFTSWTPWSECSRCGRWGRKRRYGMCHIRLADERDKINATWPTIANFKSCKEGKAFLEAFPDGVGCRSRFLPKCLRKLDILKNRPNEIMIAMCKSPCKQNVIFNLKTETGVVLERANNSAGIYSLSLPRPLQPPQPIREVVFSVRGQPAMVRCKGTSLRDIPVTWRVGENRVSERALDRESAGRVRVNARDHIVFEAVWDSDANLYSCWQNDILVGEVKLEVWSLKNSASSRVFLILGCVVALYTLHVLRGRRHRWI